VGDFAKLTRVTQATLHHYDKIGLISPVSRGEGNRYRYYSSRQLTQINVIRTLQGLGMTLSEIKTIKDIRTPGLTDEIFARQIELIENKIAEWVGSRKLLLTLEQVIHSALGVDEQAIEIKYMPAEAIILGGLNDFDGARDSYDALSDFYRVINEKFPALDLNYPVWGVFSEERVKRQDWNGPDRYFFYNPEGYDKKPAALYAIGYARGGYGQTDELYRRLLAYIAQNGFEICGNAYEEYPLNEICIADESDYLIRVMITVREAR
jgi:DNA-binding transcriptional MerR regulator